MLMNFLTTLHNIDRYVILILLIITLARAYQGWLGGQTWQSGVRRFALYTTIALDVQLLLGLILYANLLDVHGFDFGAFMESSRFYATEHIFYMIVAIALAHVGSSRVKRLAEDLQKYRALAISFTGALVLILIGMPWNRWIP